MSILKTTTNQDLTKDSTFQEMLNVLNTLPVNPKKGATGNAQVNQVLSGITFSNIDNIDLVGTMPNKSGLANQTINKQNGQYAIPEGYYDGNTKVIANFANCVAGNIKSGVDIGGIIGNYLGEGCLWAKGTTYDQSRYFNITNLSFQPKLIIVGASNVSNTMAYVRIYFTAFSDMMGTDFLNAKSFSTTGSVYNVSAPTISSNGFNIDLGVSVNGGGWWAYGAN